MSDVSATVYQRDFGPALAAPGVDLFVERFSHAAIGGPHRATISGYGPRDDLAAAFDRLRCPIVLSTRTGSPCWWGFVSRVAYTYDGVTIGASLDEMCNTVTIFYTEDVSGETVASVAGPALDEVSIAVYGVKEFRENLSQGTAGLAALRAAYLIAAQGRPLPLISWGDASGPAALSYECSGWWDTLWWRYYSRSDGATADTDQQIAAIVAASGQFLTGTIVAQASGIGMLADQDGLSRAGDIITDLLKYGTLTSGRYLATVTPGRVLRLVPEPAVPSREAMLIVREQSRQIHSPLDQPLPPHVAPVGRWARLSGPPATLRFGAMSDPTRFLIEHAEWSAADRAWALETRGVDDLRGLLEVAG